MHKDGGGVPPSRASETPLLVKVSTPLEGRHRTVAYQGKGTFFASVITLANSAMLQMRLAASDCLPA